MPKKFKHWDFSDCPIFLGKNEKKKKKKKKKKKTNIYNFAKHAKVFKIA
jgi:hypothetical protein